MGTDKQDDLEWHWRANMGTDKQNVLLLGEPTWGRRANMGTASQHGDGEPTWGQTNRLFTDKLAVEIYIGDGAMDLSNEEIGQVMGRLNNLISK